MSVTHTLNWSVSSDSSSSLNGKQAEVGTVETVVDNQFAGPGADVLFAVAFSQTTLKLIFLVSDRNMTIKVNSSTSPILTINLIANTPYVWDASPGYFANPFSAAVTAFYVTNTPSARLRGKVLNL